MSEQTSTFVQRMIGAARLDVGIYEEVEHDADATTQAAAVVVIAAACAAIGGASHGGSGIIGRAIAMLIGWAIWSGGAYLIGTRLLDGTATWGEVLRTIGFAHAPGVLYILAGVPALGSLAESVAGLWMLVAGVVAIRQALDFTTGKAILTVLIGWAVAIGVALTIALLFGLPLAILGWALN